MRSRLKNGGSDYLLPSERLCKRGGERRKHRANYDKVRLVAVLTLTLINMLTIGK